jgi:hypothetical protein
MASLAELLRQGADKLINLPSEAQRFVTNPQAFTQLITGKNPLPRETGFAASATGLPAQEMSVLDPNQAPYMQGYSQGEPIGYAGMAAPFAAPAALATGKALAPKLGQVTENYMAKQGFMPSIVPPSVVNEMGMATTLPKNDIFTQAVSNTPNARITDEGLYINLMRKQKPQQAMTESVRSGVFYLPEGSANMKHYGGSSGYGGTDKISGETLYKNPLFVKGGTGGKAPEAAYAQLTDKDQLKVLQDDVFKAIASGSPNMRNDLVEQFLEKYAPDLSGYGSYIIGNSKQGNQLRYALQEAAVAQKARDAGYDAVIGQSKGKQGPFISEVFDVRESHYPNQYGDFQLNPKFEEMYQNAPTRKELIQQQIDKIE